MFQNIQNDSYTEDKDDVKVNKKSDRTKLIMKNLLNVPNALLYILSFMMSTVGISEGQAVSPFAIAMIAACLANDIPVGMVVFACFVGTVVGFGGQGALSYLLIVLILFVLMFIVRPKIGDKDRNEKLLLGKHIVVSSIISGFVQTAFKGLLVYDLLQVLMFAITAYIFYKIFVNSIIVIKEFKTKYAFSVEEVIGATLLVGIAISALRGFSVFGFSVRNILSILLVLILGWKYGMLIGGTTGITIGLILGIVSSNSDPMLIAAFAISGLVSGILNRFGRIGVVLGFALGSGILAYVTNGNTSQIIYFKEILIASIGLLAMPKNIELNIENFIGNKKCLPVMPTTVLANNEDTIYKLNTVSETISEMANTYKEVAATVLEDKADFSKNKDIFIEELQKNLIGLEDNILYDDMAMENNEILEELFKILLEKQRLERKDLLETFAKFNNYIIGFDDYEVSRKLEKDIQDILDNVNYSYKVSKVNFIWEKKLEENKINMSKQLNGVSKMISSIADDIKQSENDKNTLQEVKSRIIDVLKEKDIKFKELEIKKEKSGRYIINIYSEIEEEIDADKLEGIFSKACNEKIVNIRISKDAKIFKAIFVSDDKFKMSFANSKTTKNKSRISGDSFLQTRLNDGKYLVALSDGMGSGMEARKSSKLALKMLEKLLKSGFEKDTSIELINTMILNSTDNIFATLDVMILDLYQGIIEFVKNGSCPTFVKNKNNVLVVKSLSLPTGIMDKIDLTVYDKDVENGDIILMCSDGVLDSNTRYENKELWIKYLLEDMKSEETQKIADLVLNEAIDNNFGVPKDDMSVITIKIEKN